MKTTTYKEIEALAKKFDCSCTREKKQGKTVMRLGGFLANLQAAAREISGYWVEQSSTGFRFYKDGLRWV